MLLSESLCELLGEKHGTELSINKVMEKICYYIRRKNLQDPTDGRKILPDKKLSNLLDYNEDGEPLTHYHLPKLLSPHLFDRKSREEMVQRRNGLGEIREN
jgi:chromatin remodeling complex protein RSC6